MRRPLDQSKGQERSPSDHRLIAAYHEAMNLDQDGIEVLCPSYAGLRDIEARYQDFHLLGKGGLKEVYRAYDNRARRWVAMARLRADRDQDFYDLLVNEAWLTSSLNHPNIINVHDVGVDSRGRPFFTMDLKGNTTLADLIAAPERSLRELLKIFLKVCDAVSYAHSRGILHLDLKPENIQADKYGEVLLCDWGLGRRLAEEKDGMSLDGEAAANVTLLGEIKGSPGFMAPEQVEEGGRKTEQTDVFSLGCILYAILTGEAPFTGTVDEVLDATKRAEIAQPAEEYPEHRIPVSLGAVCVKALAKQPDGRYQSVLELRDEVQRFLDGFSTQAESPNFLREAHLFAARNRTPVLISCLALIALTVLTTLFVQRVDRLHESVQAEAKLAERYANEVELANDLYSETISESKQQQLALSASLISYARRLKNTGIFDTPMKSVREALALSYHALELHPESEPAKYHLFTLNLIQLNFKEALRYPLDKGNRRYAYMSFARAYPKFEYSRQRRPSLPILRKFLREAAEIEPNQSHILERILSYDSALRFSLRNYDRAILEFLRYLNPGNPEFELDYQVRQARLHLRSEEEMTLLANEEGSKQCVLRFLSPRTLVLEVAKPQDLVGLNGLAIKELDLTRCGAVQLDTPIKLPSLSQIRIDRSKHSAKELRRWIESNAEFEIIGEEILVGNR
ncbi:MAG: serine/threonine-protein kinase [Verrucomicrobiota bacterium JB023]|nr:serine/threonine-protein kinase [Verrucomicrobiota bacterium JB023]